MNWTQLRAMFWLRWRLTRNQWRRQGELNAVIMLIMFVLGLVGGLLGGLAGIAAGFFGLSTAIPRTHVAVWDALAFFFLVFWFVGVAMELQKSEMLDLGRLLSLPVSLRGVFLLNYLSSHLSMSLAIFVPAMLGLAVGLLRGGIGMALLIPLVLAFFFMITAWTYLFRGWLAALMVNKRRRRAIIVAVTFTVILLAQLPNLLSNVWMRGSHFPSQPTAQTPEAMKQWADQMQAKEDHDVGLLKQLHAYLPLLWLANGAYGLACGKLLPAIGGALGMFAIGGLGLTLAYRSTIKFHMGGKVKKAAPPRAVTAVPAAAASSASAPAARAARRILVERRVPAVAEETGALALATLRSLLRAPEVKMALGTNVLIILFLGVTMLFKRHANVPEQIKPLVAGVAAAVTVMGLAQLMFNHFGFDRTGFRSLVLLPTPRHRILMGKNLAMLPIAIVVFGIYLTLAAFLARLQPWDVLAAVIEFAAAFMLVSVIGNLMSILIPYRIASGTLRPTKTNFVTSVLIFVSHMFMPLTMLPIFLPIGLGAISRSLNLLPAALVTLVGAVLLAALSAVLYWKTLEPIGQLLQSREKRILEVVTREVE
jgi:ABC-2 type transport system permease protein